MSSWTAFLAYAKGEKSIPRSVQGRSAVYQQHKEACACGRGGKMCGTLAMKQLCKASPKKYDPNSDPLMLRAKIKAYEDILKEKDELIEHYEKMLAKGVRKKSA